MTKKSARSTALGSDTSGIVLLVTVVVLVIFFICAAFVIDLAGGATASEQSRHHLKLAALAAIEEFFDTKGTTEERLDAALARANEVAGVTVSFAIGAADRTPNSVNRQMPDPAGAYMQPGRWYYQQPADGAAPCASYPCFIETTDSINAIRITGRIHDDFQPMFMRVLYPDAASIPVNGSATASVVPRHGCFLVDLSPSVTRDTHQLNGQGSEFAFALTADNPGVGEGATDRHEQDYGVLVSSYPTRSGASAADEHFADDYGDAAEIAYPILTDANFGNNVDNYGNARDYQSHHPDPISDSRYTMSSPWLKYRVDKYRSTAYKGPEPLRSIMEALKAAVEKFRERKVAGDQICLIFYDSTLAWPGIIKLSDDFDYVKDFLDWEVMNDKEKGFRLAIQHGLFPHKESFTNTKAAIEEAMRQFADASANGAPSSDFITLIGDGLTNCVECPDLKDLHPDGRLDGSDYWHAYLCSAEGCQQYCSHPARIGECNWYLGLDNASYEGNCPPPQDTCQNDDLNNDGIVDLKDSELIEDMFGEGCIFGKRCDNQLEYWKLSTDHLKDYVRDAVFPTKIPIHVVMVGNQVRPYTIDLPDENDSTKCLDERQARGQARPSVEQWDFYCWYDQDISRDTCEGWLGSTGYSDEAVRQMWNEVFEPANTPMYDIARMTGGIWAPIRPSPTGCVQNPGCSSTSGAIVSPVTNAVKRIHDPKCRTTYNQMVDYFDEIVGQNPYAIVTYE